MGIREKMRNGVEGGITSHKKLKLTTDRCLCEQSIRCGCSCRMLSGYRYSERYGGVSSRGKMLVRWFLNNGLTGFPMCLANARCDCLDEIST